MSKCATKSMAIAAARASGEMYGICVFDGHWYVGTRLQLDAIGVITPQRPKESA